MNNSHLLSSKKETRHAEREMELQSLGFDILSERDCDFSLRFQEIRPSEFFGPRSKVVLRSEGYVWAPV